jgi:hypothetical protein
MINYARQDQFLADSADVKRPTFTNITIIAFVLSNSEHAISTIVARYPLTNSAEVTISRPFGGMVENPDTTYLIAVAYTDSNGVTYRYVLFDANAEFAILYPVYSGEVLGPSATIEIWANPANTTILSSLDINFSLNTITPYSVSNTPVGFCSSISDSSLTLTAV